MPRIAEVTSFLDRFAPLELAEEWDNVGLIVGDTQREVSAVMTCLTLTPDVAAEAIEKNAQLVVSHHPLLFRAVQKITTNEMEGRMLIDLIRAGTAVYSPHTGYDSAREGINRQLAETLGLENIEVLRPKTVSSTEEEEVDDNPLGAGRCGSLKSSLALDEFLQLVKTRLNLETLQYIGESQQRIERVGIACGSAAEFMHEARINNCDVLLTGEARFHACLEARSTNIALVLVGHYASERPAVDRLANVLADKFSDLSVWASQSECDPIKWA